MKSVMFSINKPHTDNIKIGAKTSELRTRPPKIDEPYKAYIYETLKNSGCGKVIGEFTAYNKNTYRICMGVPAHLVMCGCVSAKEILAYTKNGEKDLTEISISDLVIYDEPKELSEFCKPTMPTGLRYENDTITRPPQNWCYVEEREENVRKK